jgi:hypothetical protein
MNLVCRHLFGNAGMMVKKQEHCVIVRQIYCLKLAGGLHLQQGWQEFNISSKHWQFLQICRLMEKVVR